LFSFYPSGNKSSLREAFTEPDVAQGDFYSAQQIRYQEVEPNRFLPANIKGRLGTRITNDALSQFNTYDPYTESVSNKFTAAGLSQVMQGQAKTTDEESYCRGFVGAGSLPKLISDQEADGNLPVRCGWRYKRSPGGGMPLVSQGALGTRNGPLNSMEDTLGSGVEWVWDLRKALDRHMRDFTATLPASAQGLQMAQASFSNTAWCSQTNRYIFVDEAGNPLQGYTCGENSIVTNPSNFPQTTQTSASSMASANAGTVANCMRPGNNPSLSRDCLLQAIKTNGCSVDGALYQAIESARPTATTYSQYLQTQPSFQSYQSKQGDNKITEDIFRKDRGTWEMAIREIQKLQQFTATAQDPLVKIAAEDLCLNAGKFDQYDFCSELTDSTSIAAVDLNCMQSYWQEQNGKPAGLLYPARKQLKPEFGTINTWGQFRTAVDQLKAKVSSGDPMEQRKAINNFLGASVSEQPFSPLNLDGVSQMFSLGGQPLHFWVDAADGGSLTIDQNNRVRNWGDKSGRNKALTQMSIANRPIYKKEAFAGIEFDGTASFMEIPNAHQMVSMNFTIFVVERRKSSKPENYFLGGTTINQRNQNLVLGYALNNLGRYAFWANDVDTNLQNYQMASEPIRIWTFVRSSTGRSIYINGDLVGNDRNIERLGSWAGASVGRYYTRFYQGVIHELMIYNTDLTTDRRQKLEGYLAHKWGVPMTLSSGHPYKTAAP
jgi:hypothetical protein